MNLKTTAMKRMELRNGHRKAWRIRKRSVEDDVIWRSVRYAVERLSERAESSRAYKARLN